MAPAEMWDTRTQVYVGCVMRMRVGSTWHTVMPLRHVPASHTLTQHSPPGWLMQQGCMDVFVPDAEIAEIKLVPVAEALLYPDCPHN